MNGALGGLGVEIRAIKACMQLNREYGAIMETPANPIVRVARCSCGQLRISCKDPYEKIAACHCKECQLRTGSAFGVAVFYRRSAVIVAGRSSRFERVGESGNSLEHHFCPDCGSTVFWYPAVKPDLIAIAGGNFGHEAMPAPSKSAHVNQQQSWVALRLSDEP